MFPRSLGSRSAGLADQGPQAGPGTDRLHLPYVEVGAQLIAEVSDVRRVGGRMGEITVVGSVGGSDHHVVLPRHQEQDTTVGGLGEHQRHVAYSDVIDLHYQVDAFAEHHRELVGEVTGRVFCAGGGNNARCSKVVGGVTEPGADGDGPGRTRILDVDRFRVV